MPDMNAVVGRCNLLFLTFDCLRLDSARLALADGRTPNLARVLPPSGWEARESPGTFTLPAHLAFFHGFLPTPLGVDVSPRLFALEFAGSLSTTPDTHVFAGVEDVLAGFVARGYRTYCVGGVGFFNKLNPLGHVLPGYFQESVWSPSLGVANYDSTAQQVSAALQWLESLPTSQRFVLFVNISATHPPHGMYLAAGAKDSPESQRAALAYADSRLPPLLDAVRRRGECFCLFLADHGEAHGEDGRFGHRIAHPVVTTVPYAEFFLT